MVMPTKINAIPRETNSSSVSVPSSLAGLRLPSSSYETMTHGYGRRTIHMPSQYYFLPVDDIRYDQRWVFTPPRRCSSSTSSPTFPNASDSNLAGPDDEVFDAMCQKVTAVHGDTDEESDEDIEFEPFGSTALRTVSMDNSAIFDEDSASHEDSTQSSDRPQFLLSDEPGAQSCKNDGNVDHDFDRDLEIMNFEVDIIQESSNVDSVDDDKSKTYTASFSHDYIGAVAAEEGGSEYEDDEASEKTTGRRRKPTKKGAERKKPVGKATRKKKVAKKIDPSNQPPLRALSAYNFFFRDERERLLYNVSKVLDDEKCKKLLNEHWHRDRTQKRRHRKTHGKIPFTQLSKIVSSQWKKLTEDQKDFYRGVSAKDWARYQRELEEYKAKQEEQSDSVQSSAVAPKSTEYAESANVEDDVSETSGSNNVSNSIHEAKETTGAFVEV